VAITNDFVSWDSCDDTSGWTDSADATVPSLDTVEKKEGAASINLGKSGTTSNAFYYEKTQAANNLNRKILAVWVYFANQETIDKITVARIYIFDSAGNWGYWDFLKHIKRGWVCFRTLAYRYSTLYNFDGSSPTKPSSNDIVKVRLYFETVDATTTIPEGDIKMDYWHYGYWVILDNATFNLSHLYDHDIANALGCILKSPDGHTYLLGCGVQVGQGTNLTTLYDYAKNIVFLPRTLWYWGGVGPKGGIHPLANGKVRLGQLIDESLKITRYGVSIFNESNFGSERILDGTDGEINLYSCSVISRGYNSLPNLDRVWNCFFGQDIRLETKSTGDVYNVIIVGTNAHAAPKGSVKNLTVTTRANWLGGLTYVSIPANTDVIAENVVLLNCKKDTYCYGWGQNARLLFIDCAFDHDPLICRWYASGYMTGERIWEQYRIPFKIVNKKGNNISGVTIEIYDKNGNLQSSGTTNTEGEWISEPCTYKTYGMQEGATGANELTDIWEYSPHTVVIKKPGYQTQKFKVNLRELWKRGGVRVIHRAVDVIFVDGKLALNLNEANPENELFKVV
jgi:hypothetical protein